MLRYLEQRKIKNEVIFMAKRKRWGKKFEIKLGREIQLFNYKDRKLMGKELDPKLIPNIYQGFNIKGGMEPFEVKIND